MVLGYGDLEPPKKPKHAKDYPAEELVSNVPEPIVEEKKVSVIAKVENKFGMPWKSIYAFLGVFIGQVLARAFDENNIPVLPNTVAGWGTLVGGSFLAALAVYFKKNIYTPAQAEQKVNDAQDVAIKAA